jgi:hypothetical protein
VVDLQSCGSVHGMGCVLCRMELLELPVAVNWAIVRGKVKNGGGKKT